MSDLVQEARNSELHMINAERIFMVFLKLTGDAGDPLHPVKKLVFQICDFL